MVYSAYYDVRLTNKPNIRVFGVTGSINPEKVLCRLYYDYNQKNFESKNDKKNINLINDKASFRDVHGKILVRLDEAEMMRAKAGIAFVPKYQQSYFHHPCDIICPLYDPKHPRLTNNLIPIAVSILPRPSSGSVIDHKLPVINSENGGTGT